MDNSSIIVAVTGASGSIYARRLVAVLVGQGHEVKLILSDAARKVIAHELDPPGLEENFLLSSEKVTLYDNDNIAASLASGSCGYSRMVVIPASMGTTARIATGASTCLIERAADVTIKERGELVLVPREAPFSPIHLKNMLTLSRLGVTIIPAAPGFYHKPGSIDDLIDFIVAKVLNTLKIPNDLLKPWQA